MKKLMFLWAALLLVQCTPKDGITHDVGNLPAKAQDFLSRYFPNGEVAYIEIDRGLTSMYEVVYADGTEVEFSKGGEWIEVDCKHAEVPAGIVPEPIVSYVKQHFPDLFICKIEKKGNRYEVELSNGLDLLFDKDYNIVSIEG